MVLLVEPTHEWPPTPVSLIETGFCCLSVQAGQPLAEHTFTCAKQDTHGAQRRHSCTKHLDLAGTARYISGFDGIYPLLPACCGFSCPRPQEWDCFGDSFPVSPGGIIGWDTAQSYWDQHSTNPTGVQPLTSAGISGTLITQFESVHSSRAAAETQTHKCTSMGIEKSWMCSCSSHLLVRHLLPSQGLCQVGNK